MPRAPARTALAGWALVGIVAALALAGLLGGAAAASSDVDLSRGERLYAAQCSACHGSDARGRPGQGRTAGPSLEGVDAAYVDLTLRTGRMPLLAPEVGVPRNPGLDTDDHDRESLVAWMVQAFHLEDSRPPEPVTGDAARGRELYAQHCAACHGSTGTGGVAGDGTLIRPVTEVGAVAAVEAMRVGPFRMPRFDRLLSPEQQRDVAAFVGVLDEQPTTPLGLTELDQIPKTLLVIPIVVATLGVVLLATRRVDLAEEDPR